MDEKNWEQMVREKERIGYDKMEMASLAFPALMRKVYLWMTLALAITGITAYGVANNSSLIWTLTTCSSIYCAYSEAESRKEHEHIRSGQEFCSIKNSCPLILHL